MWGETADASDVQQTIWPRAAAAAGILLDMLNSTTLYSSSMNLLFKKYFNTMFGYALE